jgi:hypothetical protein
MAIQLRLEFGTMIDVDLDCLLIFFLASRPRVIPKQCRRSAAGQSARAGREELAAANLTAIIVWPTGPKRNPVWI